MVLPYLIYALASGPLTRPRLTATTSTLQKSPEIPLASWLETNDAILSSSIGTDLNGLRGLARNADRSNGNDVVCRIPRNCIIVADQSSKKRNKRPIDALANSLLHQIRLEKSSTSFPFIEFLPGPSDLSLAGIGGKWTNEELDRLGHALTKEQFIKLRAERDHFIVRNSFPEDEVDKRLAGWAYDLASSRALQGPFGRGGTVRAALAGTVVAMMAAFMPIFYLNDLSELPFEPAIPVILSVITLVSTLVAKEPELAMIPWIDIANHKSKSRLYLEYDLLHDRIALKGESMSPDEFVTFDYGGASQGIDNNRLLGEYGFVEEDNPSDTLGVKVGRGTVTIGRRGIVHYPPSLMKDEEEVRLAARKTRDNLLLAASVASTESNDAIDSERANLAALWRKEKIRLLDEYLE